MFGAEEAKTKVQTSLTGNDDPDEGEFVEPASILSGITKPLSNYWTCIYRPETTQTPLYPAQSIIAGTLAVLALDRQMLTHPFLWHGSFMWLCLCWGSAVLGAACVGISTWIVFTLFASAWQSYHDKSTIIVRLKH